MPMPCSERLCCWIYFRGQAVARLRTHGHENDISFLCMEEEADYKVWLPPMLLRIRYFILNDYNS